MRSLLLSFLVVAGCDCLHQTQYLVEIEPSSEARRKIADVVTAALQDHGMTNQTADCTLPDAIASYYETAELTTPRGLFVGARRVDPAYIIDVGLWNPGCVGRRRQLFKEVDRTLASTLKTAFGESVIRLDDPQEFVPIDGDGTEDVAERREPEITWPPFVIIPPP